MRKYLLRDPVFRRSCGAVLDFFRSRWGRLPSVQSSPPHDDGRRGSYSPGLVVLPYLPTWPRHRRLL